MNLKKILSAVSSAVIGTAMTFTVSVSAGASYLYPSDIYGKKTSTDYYNCVIQFEGDPISQYDGAKKVGVHDFILTDEGKAAFEKIMDEHRTAEDKIIKILGKQDMKDLDVRFDYTAAVNGICVSLTKSEFDKVKQEKDALGIKNMFTESDAYPRSVTQESNEEITNEQADDSYHDYSALTQKIAELSGYDSTKEKGEGMVIAIVDNEFDTEHEYFSLSEGTEPRLSEDDVKQMMPYLTGKDTIAPQSYVSDKIPFAYNYCKKSSDTFIGFQGSFSHGTHVAGIAAGNGRNVSGGYQKYSLTGVAPEAQLLMLCTDLGDGKIFSYAYYAAYDDALYLDADVINASYGEFAYCYNGLNSRAQIDYEAANNITGTGTVFCIAAGNSARLTFGEHTDYSTGGFPCQAEGAMTVANIENPVRLSIAMITGDGSGIDIYDGTIAISEKLAGQTLEYVMIPGLGRPEDFEGIDVRGKIAVIDRGELLFIEKEKNAADRGAAGVIFVNSDDYNFGIASEKLPCAMISHDDKKTLEKCTDKTLTFYYEPIVLKKDMINTSESSSWAYTETLGIKPDIAGFGGKIYSSITDVNNNHRAYIELTGTSMAAPSLTGINALLLQHIKNDPDTYKIDDRSDIPELAAKLLMSTAAPVYYYTENEIASPRVQGNGMANVKKAIETPCYISSHSEKDRYRPKISLGDGYKDKYTLDFSVTNISKKAAGYTPDTMLFRDTFDEEGNVAEDLKRFKKDTDFNVRYTDEQGNEVKRLVVKAGETRSFSAEVTLSSSAFKAIKKDSGAFVDGFVLLKNNELPDLTLSFMAFNGDFGKVSDNGLFFRALNETKQDITSSPLYSYFSDEKDHYAGYDMITNTFDDTVYVSPNGDGVFDSLTANIMFLRRCYNVKMEISDKKGKIVYSKNYGDGSSIYKGYNDLDRISLDANFDFTGGDSIVKNSEYTMTISAEAPISGEEYSMTQKIKVDTKAPAVKSVGLLKCEDEDYFIIEASDNCKLMGACTADDISCMVSPEWSDSGKYMIVKKVTDVYGKCYAEVYDMAGNYTKVTDNDITYTLTADKDSQPYASADDKEFCLSGALTDENGSISDISLSCDAVPSDFAETDGGKVIISADGYGIAAVSPKIGILGDTNDDGKCDVRDASNIARILAGNEDTRTVFSDPVLGYFADFNKDGTVNVRDAAAIAKYLATGKK